MQIFRFDEEVSVPISAFGSRFEIGPLTGENSRVRVQAMYLPPGGFIARHPTVTKQMFAVVDGDCVVTGADGTGREIGPKYAAVWEAGEEHEASSSEGASAICIEGEFDVWAMAVTSTIVVSDYDPAWPSWFETVRANIWPAVEEVALRIDHVGSTSVLGLAAKPLIDIDVVVTGPDDVREVVRRLAGIGYRWRGDLGVPGREAFAAPNEEGLPPHNLYLVVKNNKAHVDHWLLADALRNDAGARDRYAELKSRNARLSNDDMEFYVAAKARFVADLLAAARKERGMPPETYWDPDVPDREP
jgi:GrpB-like predicted nucleotidyltransferase (UPF0157 family)